MKINKLTIQNKIPEWILRLGRRKGQVRVRQIPGAVGRWNRSQHADVRKRGHARIRLLTTLNPPTTSTTNYKLLLFKVDQDRKTALDGLITIKIIILECAVFEVRHDRPTLFIYN